MPWFGLARWLWLQGSLIRGGWSLFEPSWLASTYYWWHGIAAIFGWGWWLVGAMRRYCRGSSSGSDGARFVATGDPVFDSVWTPTLCVLACASVTAGLGYHAIQSMLAWGNSTTGAWYAAPAFPWFQLVAIAGALSWPWRLGRAVSALLVGCYVATEQSMLWTQMLRTYSGGAPTWDALRRVAQLQPPLLGTAVCLASWLTVRHFSPESE